MNKSLKTKIEHEKAVLYLQENWMNTNELSSDLLRQVNFQSGEFYTILPANTKREDIEKFNCGG